jgi:hypothetical protein
MTRAIDGARSSVDVCLSYARVAAIEVQTRGKLKIYFFLFFAGCLRARRRPAAESSREVVVIIYHHCVCVALLKRSTMF